MNSELIEKFNSIQEYLKIDPDALKKEIESTTEMIEDLKTYKSNLKRIRRLTDEVKEIEFTPEYKGSLVEIMERYPQIKSIREAEVMLQALKAIPNRQIALNLCISEKTIKFHKTNIFKRCGFKNSLDMIKQNYNFELQSRILPRGNP